MTLACDLWGWTDEDSGRNFVLLAGDFGVAFIEVTHPECPMWIGSLPTTTFISSRVRDVKVYDDHAFVVAEGSGGDGMQVFDLRRLLDVTDAPVTFDADAHHESFGRAHNLAIDTDSGFAYGAWTSACSGLHIMDISTPLSPVDVACHAAPGPYIHDAMCTVYRGPDVEQQICVTANGEADTISIIDVTDKAAIETLSEASYPDASFPHQGWLTEDHAFLLTNDERDEIVVGGNGRTFLWDVRDLEMPVLTGIFEHDSPATDHNLFIRGDYAYLANYAAGLRILDISEVAQGRASEVGWFDLYPPTDDAGIGSGAFSAYPWFPDGLVALTDYRPNSDGQGGLFLLRFAPGDAR